MTVFVVSQVFEGWILFEVGLTTVDISRAGMEATHLPSMAGTCERPAMMIYYRV